MSQPHPTPITIKNLAIAWTPGDTPGLWTICTATSLLLAQAQAEAQPDLSTFLRQGQISATSYLATRQTRNEVRKSVNFVCKWLLQDEAQVPTLPRARLYYFLARAALLDEDADKGVIREMLGSAREMMGDVQRDLEKHGVLGWRVEVEGMMREVEVAMGEVGGRG